MANRPDSSTSTLSPGSTRLVNKHSIPADPVPLTASVISFFVRKTSRSRARALSWSLARSASAVGRRSGLAGMCGDLCQAHGDQQQVDGLDADERDDDPAQAVDEEVAPEQGRRHADLRA